jgi:hypothetical protein
VEANWPWTSGGDEFWEVTTNISHDGIDSANSGPIDHNETSYLDSMVTGPGVITIWCKVSSERDYDFLNFTVDGVLMTSLSGELDWHTRTFQIPAGVHVLRWAYTKDYSYSSGSDRAWLDQITFTTNGLPVIAAHPVNLVTTFGATATFSVKALGGGLTYQWFRNDTAITDATAAVLVISNVQPADVGSYRVVVTNTVGTVTSAPAILRIASSALPRLTGLQISNGTLSGTVERLLGTGTIVIERSPNLIDWFSVQTNTVTSTNLSISLPLQGEAGEFFRLVER